MSKRLILPRTGSALLMKSHVSGYTKKDGTFVQEHDDKRQKKADAYSHPHVVGKATHEGEAHDAPFMSFAGTQYASTGKSGKSFHDETPVREFEAEDGHRVWMDHHSRVHADSKDEVPHLRKKFEAHQSQQAEVDAGRDPASQGEAAAKDEGGEPKVSKADVINATLGQHNGLGYVSVPPGKGQHKVEEFVDKIESLGFGLDEGTTYDVNGDSVQLDKNEQGKAVLTNPAGQKVIILAQDGGDKVKISVTLMDGEKTPDKAAGGVSGGSAAPKADKPAGGADKPSGGEKKPKAKAKPAKVTPAALKKHPMWSQSDFDYFKGKGYTPEQIKEIWDRDHAAGNKPVEHKDIPDVFGAHKKVLEDMDKKSGGKLFKAIADGARLVLGRKP